MASLQPSSRSGPEDMSKTSGPLLYAGQSHHFPDPRAEFSTIQARPRRPMRRATAPAQRSPGSRSDFVATLWGSMAGVRDLDSKPHDRRAVVSQPLCRQVLCQAFKTVPAGADRRATLIEYHPDSCFQRVGLKVCAEWLCFWIGAFGTGHKGRH